MDRHLVSYPMAKLARELQIEDLVLLHAMLLYFDVNYRYNYTMILNPESFPFLLLLQKKKFPFPQLVSLSIIHFERLQCN